MSRRSPKHGPLKAAEVAVPRNKIFKKGSSFCGSVLGVTLARTVSPELDAFSIYLLASESGHAALSSHLSNSLSFFGRLDVIGKFCNTRGAPPHPFSSLAPDWIFEVIASFLIKICGFLFFF